MVLKGLDKFVKDNPFGGCDYMRWSKCCFQISEDQKGRYVGAGKKDCVMLLVVQTSSICPWQQPCVGFGFLGSLARLSVAALTF